MLRASRTRKTSSRPRVGAAVAAAFFVLASLVVAGLVTHDARAAEDGPVGYILATGNVVGFLEECGCKINPLGSVARRAGYVRALANDQARSWQLLLDVGNFSDTPGPAGETKTRGLVKAMQLMGYDAAGVGERDLRLGPAHVEELAATVDFPFLSANLLTSRAGAPDEEWLPPSRIFDYEGFKVGVVATTRFNPLVRHPMGDDGALVARDPQKVLAPVIESLAAEADLVVLLGLVPAGEARNLVKRFPEIDLVLGAHGNFFTNPILREGSAQILYLGDEGRYVGRIAVHREGESKPTLDVQLIPLSRDLPDDPNLELHVAKVLARAQEAERLRFASVDPTGEQQAAGQFLGSGGCTACHSDLVGEWVGSAHEDAFSLLKKEVQGPQANCIPCHVTGYGQQGGWVSEDLTPHLLGVGCESCHGPGNAHAAQPSRPYGKVSLATCTSCHTAEQDPDFNYYEALPMVNHGSSSDR